MPDRTKYILDERDMPTSWYNVQPDLPEPLAPPLDPEGNPIGPEQLAVLFPMECIMQEVSQERYIDIPGAVLDVYKTYRPSPLNRAKQLERVLGLPAGIKIFYKYEGVSPAGSHKPNTAIPQAYYNKLEGIKKISTETGAGQWGSALAIAGALYGIDVEVFMVKVSYDQKPYRRFLMETYGATVHPSPSNLTDAGRHVLAMDPDSTGSLGIAISEAVEVAAKNPDTHYALGSVLNHVCLHQTIIGQECIAQMEIAADEPDVVIRCVGGGSHSADNQIACVEAAVQFPRAERILPAPESSHAIRAAIDEALAAKEAGEDKVVLFNLSGHGHFDLAAYEAYNSGKLVDYDYAAGTTLCEAE